jgi:MFS family permease
MMPQQPALTRADLKTPKAAAIAGLLFSILLMAIFLLLRLAASADPSEPGTWLIGNARQITWAVNLVPFAGVAFLWFIGVLRDRLGEQEDRFFATVFFGSGLLFLGMLLILAAFTGGLVAAFEAQPHAMIDSATFYFVRSAIYSIANIYMAKMAAVFMMTTSMVAIYTAIAPRWLAIVGLTLAPLLLFGSSYLTWLFIAFPLWVMLISASVLRDNFRPPS